MQRDYRQTIRILVKRFKRGRKRALRPKARSRTSRHASRLRAHEVPIATRFRTIWRIHDKRDFAIGNHVANIGMRLGNLAYDLTAHVSATQRARGAFGRHNAEAQTLNRARDGQNVTLVAIDTEMNTVPSFGSSSSRRAAFSHKPGYVLAMPMTSPVDFISGPSTTFAPGSDPTA